MKGVSVKCMPDPDNIKINGKRTIKLRVTINRNRKYYATQYEASDDEWLKIKGDAPLRIKDLVEIRDAIKEIEVKAKNVLEGLTNPSHDQFVRLYKGEDESNDDPDPLISDWFNKYQKELVDKKRPWSYCMHFKTTRDSLEQYRSGTRFSQINVKFAEGYRKWLEERGKTPATYFSYMRNLRTVYNAAVKANVIPKENNPFGGEIKIGKAKGRKLALSYDELERIMDVELGERSKMDLARDMFLLQYFLNGLNIIDLCKLKRKQLSPDGDVLSFYRTKTSLTDRDPELVVVSILPDAKEILHKWAYDEDNPESYLVPFFKDVTNPNDPETLRKNIQQATEFLNRNLKKIQKLLDIKVNLTTGVARSTFANMHKTAGTPTSQIADMMGHQDEKTTQIYLKGIDVETLKKAAQVLIPPTKRSNQ
jgi:integrase/recombinase XerD